MAILPGQSGAKLMDVGLAQLGSNGKPALGISDLPTGQQSITAEDMIIGTLHYKAPEQLKARR